MIANATLRRNAASSVKQISTGGFLLPFLYSTPTICAERYTTAEAVPLDRRPRPQRRQESSGDRPQRRPLRDRRNNAPGRQSYGDWQTRQPRESNVTDRNERPNVRSRLKPVREDHIPFERPGDEKAAVNDVGKDILDGSTVTPSERKAFENLFNLQRNKRLEEKGGQEKVMGTATGVAAAQQPGRDTREMPHALNQLELSKQEPETSLSSKPTATVDTSLDKAISSDISRVDSMMVDAQTDVDLWRVLHEQVITRVLALGLDARVEIRPKKAVKKAAKNASEAPLPTKPHPHDLQILTQTFPKHLLGFITHCNASFSGSHLPSTLLPYIKTLGPATFALAATTELYNKHMRALYYYHHDLVGIVATLDEMEQQVYEFDTMTFDLLGKILRKATQAQEGKLGEGINALWGGERDRSTMRKILVWRKKVEGRIQEKALKEAREKEGEDEAE